jgi:heat shock factor-binding protein 1
MSEAKAETVPENAQDLTIFVQNLLEQMQQRFNQMSTSIIGRIDDMGTRIDDLEKSISDLMTQAGIEQEKGAPPGDS